MAGESSARCRFKGGSPDSRWRLASTADGGTSPSSKDIISTVSLSSAAGAEIEATDGWTVVDEGAGSVAGSTEKLGAISTSDLRGSTSMGVFTIGAELWVSTGADPVESPFAKDGVGLEGSPRFGVDVST